MVYAGRLCRIKTLFFFFRTLFTGIERYTFVDPDYAFTDEEEQLRLEHKQQYLDYIKTLRQNRLADKKTRYPALYCLTKLNNCGILTSISWSIRKFIKFFFAERSFLKIYRKISVKRASEPYYYSINFARYFHTSNQLPCCRV